MVSGYTPEPYHESISSGGIAPERRTIQLARVERSRPVPLVVGAYAAVTAVALLIGFARHEPNLLLCTPWHAWESRGLAHVVSALLGLAFAALVVSATRLLVRTQPWATALHEDLRPFARALGAHAVVPVAIASAVGEEALFRGALVPALGLVGSSVLFGALHQLRGRSRFTWVLFAALVGLALAAMFRFTGSLVGPVVAHAVINGANLRFLLAHDTRRAPQLGGLLGGDRPSRSAQ